MTTSVEALADVATQLRAIVTPGRRAAAQGSGQVRIRTAGVDLDADGSAPRTRGGAAGTSPHVPARR